MLADFVLKDSTNRSVRIRFIGASTHSTPGDPVTVDHATSGLALWYRRTGGAKVAVTPAALAALTDAHTDGGTEAISDGWSRVDLPDAAFEAGVEYVEFGGSATDIIGIGGVIRLTNLDLDTAVGAVVVDATGATVDLATALKEIYAKLVNDASRSGDAYTYEDKNGDALFVQTLASTTRTRSAP